MTEPAYVSIAGKYAQLIRSGKLPAGTQLPSYAEIAKNNGVSDIVVRKAIELLQRQGLVRSVRRRGIFVLDRPTLVRVAPERQLEDPEVTYGNESADPVTVEREVQQVRADDEIAEIFGVAPGDEITHTVTRAAEGERPVSISDTYQPLDVTDTSSAAVLEEAVSDQMPKPAHAEWLRTQSGELVKVVRQRFITSDGSVIMTSEVSYPRDRYDAYVFRMALT